MKKLSVVLSILFLVLGAATSASALTYGFGYSEINTNSYSVQSDSWGQHFTYGVYSAGGAWAAASGSAPDDDYYVTVLDDWAEAYTSDSYAESGFENGYLYSYAEATAGGGSGEASGAVAANYAKAYGIYIGREAEVTFSIEYDIEAEAFSDDPGGYAISGAAALFGVFQNGELEGDLDLVGSYYGNDDASGWLSFDLLLDPGMYTVFAGTASWAYAEAPDVAPVPEPATMMLLGTGLIGIAGFSRKKLNKKN